MVKIGITGAAGRMGRMLIDAVQREKEARLTALTEIKGSPAAGTLVAGVTVSDDIGAVAGLADVFIDFTLPAATVANIQKLADSSKAAVIGTTGLTETELNVIKKASEKIPVVLSSNYSIGVNVMWKLLKDATKIMKEGYDIDIVESHHRMKKDAPSGTAVTTAEVILKEKGLDYSKNAVFGREGRDNTRNRDELGVFAVRGGGVVGEHTVYYMSDGDKLEIKHTAFSRETFAAGAVRAALFIAGKKPGLYSMSDVLGL